MAAALLSMAYDNATVITSGPHDAYISETTLEFDESIRSHKSMVRMGPAPALSCIGLVWRHFGIEILDRLGCLPEYQEIVWRRVDKDFITRLDSTLSHPITFSTEAQKEMVRSLTNTISETVLEHGTEIYIQQLLNEKEEKCYIEIENGKLPWRNKVTEYNQFNQEGHPVKFVVYPYETGFVAETVELFPTGIPGKSESQKGFCFNKEILVEELTKMS